MVMIGKLTIGQSASVQTTQLENQESVSNQPQSAETSHASTKAANSENTWQRAALKQDELSKKSVLTEKLTGGPIAGKSDHDTKKDGLRGMIENANEEIKKLQAELDEVYDSSFVSTTGNYFYGADKGVEFQGESNVNETTARKLTAKTSFGSDDDD